MVDVRKRIKKKGYKHIETDRYRYYIDLDTYFSIWCYIISQKRKKEREKKIVNV